MPTSPRAVSQWVRADHAYSHYEAYLRSKPTPLVLSFTDLVYVKNFKGGASTITESMATLPDKLAHYAASLRAFAGDPSSHLSLGAVPAADFPRISKAMMDFVELPEKKAADISGFGCSFASALLHFHFPMLVPILDKRALNGSGLAGLEVDRYGNVTNLLTLYPALIDNFRKRLQANPALTLRELDRTLFIEELHSPPFRKKTPRKVRGRSKSGPRRGVS